MMRWIYYPKDAKKQIMSNISLTCSPICIPLLDPATIDTTMIQSESAIILNICYSDLLQLCLLSMLSISREPTELS